jgi:hypothetical protein
MLSDSSHQGVPKRRRPIDPFDHWIANEQG